MRLTCSLALAGLFALALPGSAVAAPGDVAARRVADIHPGSPGSSPSQMVNVNGTVFFVADDGVNGDELWKSDGTAPGTTIVEDLAPGGGGIRPGADGSQITGLTNVAGTVFFQAYGGAGGIELWKSDGTPAGTMMVEDAVPGGGINPGAASSYPQGITDVNGTAFFQAYDDTNGFELWRSDGTPAGTTIVEDSVPGGGINPGFASSGPTGLTNVNGTLFFSADDGANGGELWRSDGTPAGTAMVPTMNQGGGINGGAAGSFPTSLTNVNGTLYFAADDGLHARELWKSDGTQTGTKIVAETIPGSFANSGPEQLTNVNGTLFFSANNGGELWRSDGTPAGTTMVGGAGGFPLNLTNVNGTLFFAGWQSGAGNELWRSDGTPAGTTMVQPPFDPSMAPTGINPGAASSDPSGLTSINGTLFFQANDGSNGAELWRSDGTPAGTRIVEDAIAGGGLSPGAASSSPTALANANGTLYFAADDGTDGVELWKATIEGSPPSTPGISGGSTGSTGSTGTTGSTGQRAAALQKCKKKHGRARAKCKKRARLLPV